MSDGVQLQEDPILLTIDVLPPIAPFHSRLCDVHLGRVVFGVAVGLGLVGHGGALWLCALKLRLDGLVDGGAHLVRRHDGG